MKNKLLIILTASLSLSANAMSSDMAFADDSKCREVLQTPIPESHCETLEESGWRDNWFLNVSGGANAFIGSPIGCDDLFGRLKPTFNINFGKWFTPRVGARIVYQGMWFKDCEDLSQRYHHGHADLLWNPMAHYYNSRDRPFELVPYAGVGLLHHRGNGNNSFALSYGLIGRYRLNQRLHLTMELGGTTTFKNFDGRGDSRELGDNLLNLTAGVSITIGRTGWRHNADVRQFNDTNDLYNSYNLDKGSRSEADSDVNSDYISLKNNYSGYNSLMARLYGDVQSTERESEDSMVDAVNRDSFISYPLYMFFKLGTANLTDESQLLNLDEIARVAKKTGLKIKVIGAADSATGNAEINNQLGRERAQFVCTQLLQRGISATSITAISEGGINDYYPNEANRNTRIELEQL